MNTATIVMVATIGFALFAGWQARGVMAERDMAKYVAQQTEDARRAQEQVDLQRQADAKNLSQSTKRVDTIEHAQQVEVQYVDREVIKYRDRPVAGKCVLPAEWVRLYNESGKAPGQLSTATQP